MEKFYLGFDAGTQSVKVTVYNEKNGMRGIYISTDNMTTASGWWIWMWMNIWR